jgi:hypothetical protein
VRSILFALRLSVPKLREAVIMKQRKTVSLVVDFPVGESVRWLALVHAIAQVSPTSLSIQTELVDDDGHVMSGNEIRRALGKDLHD